MEQTKDAKIDTQEKILGVKSVKLLMNFVFVLFENLCNCNAYLVHYLRFIVSEELKCMNAHTIL